MNKLEKKKLYDQTSKLLTEYEDAKSGENLEKNWEIDLYSMLVDIHNVWGELTEGDEDAIH